MIAGLIAYFGITKTLNNPLANYLFWSVPTLGGAVSAFIEQKNKIKAGVLTTIPALFIIGVGWYSLGKYGMSDFIGLQGTVIAMLISSPFIFIACTCGAIFGKWISKITNRQDY